MILTYRYRIKDASSRRHLEQMARAVNYVWNYCGDIQVASHRLNRRWPSAYDLMKLTAGSSALLGVNSDTIEATCIQFAQSRSQHRRRPRWRGRKSLGWIPFRKPGSLRITEGAAVYFGRRLRFWQSREIGGDVKTGSFSQDARGRWYMNLHCEVAETPTCGTGEIGIDLGLKTFATLSNGEKIENPRALDRYAKRLATAQRAARRSRVRAIHAKIEATRRHNLHIQSTRLVRRFQKIVVGDVNAEAMKRSFAGKSVSDAAWSTFRAMLHYKAIRHGADYQEVNERYTSQACSECGSISGPKGRQGLEIRAWTCGDCGAVHDRDVNAARNILGAECRPPAVGIAHLAKALNIAQQTKGGE
jgi:putative transposase